MYISYRPTPSRSSPPSTRAPTRSRRWSRTGRTAVISIITTTIISSSIIIVTISVIIIYVSSSSSSSSGGSNLAGEETKAGGCDMHTHAHAHAQESLQSIF